MLIHNCHLKASNFYTLDTEMVLMEFLEGIGRLANMRLRRANAEEVDFPRYLDSLLSDCSSRFPHWAKYGRQLDAISKITPRLEAPVG